ncbi:MAG: GDP-L-fucose synthase [Niabella sp.]
MNKTDKIYVAGHRGLVGSAIWRSLENKGYTNLVGRSSAELDLRNASSTLSFFNEEKPDYVILAAAHVGGIVANNTYRADFIHNNLAIQQNVIDAGFKTNIKKLLFLGSTCIYPKDAPQPIKEEYLLTGPLEITNEPYAIAKIAGIKSTESFNLQYGTNYISVMPTNLYGPNDNFDLERSHVLPAMIRKFLLGFWLETGDWKLIQADFDKRPIEGINGASEKKDIIRVLEKYGVTSAQVEIWGTGTPLREFLWSEDMADACVFLMENVDFSDLKKNSIENRNFHINIGTGKDISIKDLALLIKDKVGFKGDIYFNTEKPDGTFRKLTDVTKIHSLGWQHTIEIEEGVTKMIDWYKSSIA